MLKGRLRHPVRPLRSDRRGAVAVVAALLGTALVGSAALALDVSAWQANANAMQGAADQAVLAASFALANGAAAARNEARGIVAANGFMDGKDGVRVTVAIPPASGAKAGATNAIQVTVAQPQTTYLSQALIGAAPTISVSAVAASPQVGTCIMALATSGAGIAASGSGKVGAPNCNIYVNGASGCTVALSGLTLTGYDVNLSSSTDPRSCSSGGGVSATHQLRLGAPPAADPYRSRIIPTPSLPCRTLNTSPRDITLDPGTYCSNISLSGTHTITLNSGLYVFDGAGIASSGTTTFNGKNVSLVFTSSKSNYGSISSSGSLNFNLTPMTTGPTAGIAIWMDARGSADIAFSSTANLNLAGAVYVPSGNVTWSGNMTSPCTQLIANRITFSGSANFRHDCAGLNVADVAGSGSSGSYKLVE